MCDIDNTWIKEADCHKTTLTKYNNAKNREFLTRTIITVDSHDFHS